MHQDDFIHRDQNDYSCSGIIVDEPKAKTLKSGQKSISFTFLVVEHFTLGNGQPGKHENYFTVEALGRQAEAYLNELVVGERYQIKGYLRAEGTSIFIRCFKVQTDVISGNK